MATTRSKVSDTAENVKPYVERALRDEQLRDNVKHAFVAAKDVYRELVGDRRMASVATRVATDREIQESLRTAIEELRSAARRLQGKEERRGRAGRLLLTGIALGILFNPATGPATRKWLKEKLLGGGGGDFTYASGNSK